MEAEQFFRSLGDGTRLRCLMLLQAEGELCVCELTHALDLPQPRISRHLGHLRAASVVQDRRDGYWVHYRLHPELPEWARAVLADTAAGLGHREPWSADIRRLATMPDRPTNHCCA